MNFPGFIGPAYMSVSRLINAQRCVNLRLEIDAANGKQPLSLVGLPGYKVVKSDFPTGEVRQFWKVKKRVFVVVGDTLYELFSDLSHISRGKLPSNSGPVVIADNGLQLLAVDGVGVLALNLGTNVATNLIEGFPPNATHIVCLDNTFLANEGGTQRVQYSAVGDGLLWDPLDVLSAESVPDNVVGLMRFGSQLYVNGEESLEVLWNSGDPNRPFVPLEGSTAEVGCIAPASIAKDEGGVYWLGADARGGPRVYLSSGGRTAPISTPAMDAAFTGSLAEPAYVLQDARGYTFRMDGHVYYVLLFPTSDKTWIYDATTQGWSEFLEWDTQWRRHRSNCAMYAFGRQLIGDFENGKLYELSNNTFSNAGSVQRALRSSAHVSENQQLFSVSSIEVVCEHGVGLTTGQGQDPQMMLRVSRDGGYNWTPEVTRPIGKVGDMRGRTRFTRPCGNTRDLVAEVSITDPVKRVLVQGIINGI